MKTLTIDEAMSNLPNWLRQAIAGEEIGIRSGDAVVVLRPLASPHDAKKEYPSPREALQRLQQDSRLSRVEAESYLKEVRAERIAAEDRGTT